MINTDPVILDPDWIRVAVVDKFLRYVAVDTRSEAEQETFPSTEKQRNLASLLAKELEAMGASQVSVDEHAYVYAVLPSNLDREEIGGKTATAVGFLAHMDTSPDASGKNVKARIVEGYDGGDICLNRKKGLYLLPKEFPSLKKYIGQDLIVTGGTTLLGADDKAGVAEIMTMAHYLLTHPEIPHGKICIGFTPDEEVGRGTDFFRVKDFGADVAYTVDGGPLGELEYENFNAAAGRVKVRGKGVHPGTSKNTMKNASLIAMEFHGMLPVEQNPMYTEGYEGFFHMSHMEGNVVEAELRYIIRDHDREKFEAKKALFLRTADYLNEKYGADTVTASVKDTYYNMREKIEPHMELIDKARAAMKSLGITPAVVPIRGGTDGARLSFMGLPCPNLCTGGENFHGVHEYISIQSMEKVTELLIQIARSFA